jgi:hypothetical protein
VPPACRLDIEQMQHAAVHLHVNGRECDAHMGGASIGRRRHDDLVGRVPVRLRRGRPHQEGGLVVEPFAAAALDRIHRWELGGGNRCGERVLLQLQVRVQCLLVLLQGICWCPKQCAKEAPLRYLLQQMQSMVLAALFLLGFGGLILLSVPAAHIAELAPA